MATPGSGLGPFMYQDLPAYEVPLASVSPKKPIKQIRPFTEAKFKKLDVTAIGLGRAIVKTDCYARPRFEWFMAFIFLIQHREVFDWFKPSDVRLNPGARNLHFDFVNTTLIGRVGNGVTILLADKLGFPFHMHLMSHLRAKGIPTMGLSKKGKPVQLPIPDFLCGNGTQTAIFESKGSFPVHNTQTSVREFLYEGLEQLDGKGTNWVTKTGAKKGYAVCTSIRESSDPFKEGSFVAYVDPESDDIGPEAPITLREICDANYAAWFVAMGLPDVAARLRGHLAERRNYRFWVYGYEPLQLAFPMDDNDEQRFRSRLADHGFIPRFGIRLAILRALEKADPLGRILGILAHDGEVPLQFSSLEGDSYSMGRDGTFLGYAERPTVPETITVRL